MASDVNPLLRGTCYFEECGSPDGKKDVIQSSRRSRNQLLHCKNKRSHHLPLPLPVGSFRGDNSNRVLCISSLVVLLASCLPVPTSASIDSLPFLFKCPIHLSLSSSHSPAILNQMFFRSKTEKHLDQSEQWLYNK